MDMKALLTSAWVVSTVCFAGAATYWQWSGLVAAHEREATNLHRIVSQRVDQHDAHLTGISALSTSSEAPPLEALRTVAATIIQFYPRIVAVDIVAIDHGLELLPHYTSRDNPDAVPTDLIVSAARRGSRRAEVVNASAATGHYLLVKRAPNSDAARYALSVEIDGHRLVATDPAMSADIALVLALPDGRTVFETAVPPDMASGARVHLTAEKTLASPSQPMHLLLRRHVPVMSLVPWGAIATFGAVIGALMLLVRNMLTARLAAQDAVARAALSAQEARLAQATRINAMGELSLGIAHELTQPLAALLGQSQAGLRMLKSDVHDHEAIRSVLEANARHAKRAGALLQKLRDWNSADPPSNHVVDLNQVVTEIASLNRADLERRGISLGLDMVEPPPLASADQIGLEQIVQNLLVNARDATEPTVATGKRITFRTFAEGDRVGFTVSDQGPGFAAGMIDRVFEPFFTSKPDGMGLGLSICRRLVDRFGGEIRAANQTDGHVGAVITVVLPVHRNDPGTAATMPERC